MENEELKKLIERKEQEIKDLMKLKSFLVTNILMSR